MIVLQPVVEAWTCRLSPTNSSSTSNHLRLTVRTRWPWEDRNNIWNKRIRVQMDSARPRPASRSQLTQPGFVRVDSRYLPAGELEVKGQEQQEEQRQTWKPVPTGWAATNPGAWSSGPPPWRRSRWQPSQRGFSKSRRLSVCRNAALSALVSVSCLPVEGLQRVLTGPLPN